MARSPGDPRTSSEAPKRKEAFLPEVRQLQPAAGRLSVQRAGPQAPVSAEGRVARPQASSCCPGKSVPPANTHSLCVPKGRRVKH